MVFIDISEHNEFKDYGQLKYSDIGGVIIKATEGVTYNDSKMMKHYENIVNVTSIGFYHMLCVTSSPELQAEHFYNRIHGLNYNIVPVIDVEYNNLSACAEDYTLRFINRFKELSNIECMIYTGKCYANDNFSKEFRKSFNWWIASYGTSKIPDVDCCNLVGWQYTEKCTDYPFIEGYVDKSILYQDKCFFMGDDFQQPKGMSNVPNTTDIMVLQNELNRQGFKDKNGNSLLVDGVAGELTLSACPTLKIGAKGNITMWVQNKIGVDTDGVFGSQTYSRIISFQKDHGLIQDGVIGKNTWRELLK